MAEVSPRAHVAPGARLGAGVIVEPFAVIHDGVSVADGCVIEAGAVVGKRPRLRPGSSAQGAVWELTLQHGVTVCCGAVLYAGARIGAGAIVGDQAQVRERSVIGSGSVIGRGSSVDFDASVGERVLIQTGVYITARSVVEDDVFIGPGVVTTNDDTIGRRRRGEELRGPLLRRACRIGGGAVLVPGVEVGEEAFVAAGAVVTRDVPPRAVVAGVPARVIREVGEAELIERRQRTGPNLARSGTATQAPGPG